MLNGEISTESVDISVNNNMHFNKIEILSIYTIWDRLSLKTISRYCPFKIKAILSVLAMKVFTIFGCLFVEKIKKKFLLASIKSLTNSENPSSNPLQEAFSCFQEAACDPESCSESRLLYFTLSLLDGKYD
jgi:hypothetical protein